MKKLLDLAAIVSGVIGMGSLLVNWGTLTPENATMQGARAIIVLALVLVPYFVARAVEKSSFSMPVPRILPVRARHPQHATQTSYFDYLFQPGSADDWSSTRIANMPSRRNANNARGVEM